MGPRWSLSDEEYEKVYEEMDPNGDGSVDFDEFSEWWAKQEKYDQQKMADISRATDKAAAVAAAALAPEPEPEPEVSEAEARTDALNKLKARRGGRGQKAKDGVMERASKIATTRAAGSRFTDIIQQKEAQMKKREEELKIQEEELRRRAERAMRMKMEDAKKKKRSKGRRKDKDDFGDPFMRLDAARLKPIPPLPHAPSLRRTSPRQALRLSLRPLNRICKRPRI